MKQEHRNMQECFKKQVLLTLSLLMSYIYIYIYIYIYMTLVA
jgi:hypothetical protein